ncbi:helix-turn-helix domain-containing protein, partial [Blautia pseudococcoides]|nr:helix-turn-helix domain-containing protein [Blautia pseudococcoides]
MDQKKIGGFFKMLRKEKGLTQEQLAEHFNVTGRTVSRWETGNNMPDLDILVEMADYYDVDLRELLDGERKSEKMNKDLEETVLKVADYSSDEKMRLMKKLHIFSWIGVLCFMGFIILEGMG